MIGKYDTWSFEDMEVLFGRAIGPGWRYEQVGGIASTDFQVVWLHLRTVVNVNIRFSDNSDCTIQYQYMDS